MSVCYWCGREVEEGKGAREHIVPHALLQDTTENVSGLVIPAENAHEVCNRMLADTYEHDFCQIIFHYSAGDPKAQKHSDSKKRNLERRLTYAANQFKKMRLKDGRTEIELSASDKNAFEECVKKIIKGLYFKQASQYLDLDKEWSIRIVWNTFNLEHDVTAQAQTKAFLELLGGDPLKGNDVFKFRFKKVDDGVSSIWEFLFYDRFPVYAFLIHETEKSGFKSTPIQD
ncbi:MAG TPA: hypothetical protein VG984_01420 [Candidatus Paceibacterota bacterium]|nr:hypothetical protein [Candidatus Paceibacterota bacterium]